jgi:hypothetical protein
MPCENDMSRIWIIFLLEAGLGAENHEQVRSYLSFSEL